MATGALPCLARRGGWREGGSNGPRREAAAGPVSVMESVEARTLLSFGRLSRGLPFGRAHGLSSRDPLLPLAPRSQVGPGWAGMGGGSVARDRLVRSGGRPRSLPLSPARSRSVPRAGGTRRHLRPAASRGAARRQNRPCSGRLRKAWRRKLSLFVGF